jgi:hypothetical protein
MAQTVRDRDSVPSEGTLGGADRRAVGVRLLRRLVIYHAILVAAVVAVAVAFPDFTHQLPIGGVRQLVEAGEATHASALDASPGAAAAAGAPSVAQALDHLGTARQFIIILVGVWLLMLPVSWVHRCIHRSSVHDHSLDETVLILPGIVAGLVVVVQHSLALAFSLAGIVAGVQFRRALQDTFDALFILVAIGTGIAAGVRALEIAAVLTVFFTYSTLYVHYFGDGLESDFLARKKAEKKARKHAGESADNDDDAD